MANGLDPDQDRHSDFIDLDPICLQKSSADDKIRGRHPIFDLEISAYYHWCSSHNTVMHVCNKNSNIQRRSPYVVKVIRRP